MSSKSEGRSTTGYPHESMIGKSRAIFYGTGWTPVDHTLSCIADDTSYTATAYLLSIESPISTLALSGVNYFPSNKHRTHVNGGLQAQSSPHLSRDHRHEPSIFYKESGHSLRCTKPCGQSTREHRFIARRFTIYKSKAKDRNTGILLSEIAKRIFWIPLPRIQSVYIWAYTDRPGTGPVQRNVCVAAATYPSWIIQSKQRALRKTTTSILLLVRRDEKYHTARFTTQRETDQWHVIVDREVDFQILAIQSSAPYRRAKST